ncbi:MAG: cytochrome c biogenesis protein CcsA, partial [Solobacterium sp.]|nr:cytochrome c biogenesis protein CcsA [Solobacterium sp.]
MLDILFYAGIGLYFLAMILQFFGQVWNKENLQKISWSIYMMGFAAHTGYLLARGITAGRIPMSNQFEFAVMFSWGISTVLVFLHYRTGVNWLTPVGMIMAWGIYLYAALLPREIHELMPALRSVWFVSHIGSAAFSYSMFMLAGASGIRYLLISGKNPEDDRL